MRKLLVFFIITLYMRQVFAYYTETVPNFCGNISLSYDRSMYAVFAPNQYTCQPGEFLPANTLECKACPLDYECIGGTFTFNESSNQGLNNPDLLSHSLTNICAKNIRHAMFAVFTPNEHICASGYYLPANVDECTLCPMNNVCAGGTYVFNEKESQGITPCNNGYFSPAGSDSICYPHVLHIGDNNIYLKTTKETTPSLNVKFGNTVFYANMTPVQTYMNKDSQQYLKTIYNNQTYYVCDDTICGQ